MKTTGDNRLNIVMTIQVRNSPKFVWKMFVHIASGRSDLVNSLHTQTRLKCDFGLNGGIPWLFGLWYNGPHILLVKTKTKR